MSSVRNAIFIASDEKVRREFRLGTTYAAPLELGDITIIVSINMTLLRSLKPVR